MSASSTPFLARAARRLLLKRNVELLLREVNDTWSLSEVRARVVRIASETHDVKTFVLRPNRAWRGHRAGQFVPVHVDVDGVRTTRCYSLSSAPGGRTLSITVKRVSGGRVSNALHDNVKVGDVIALGEAGGEFVLPVAPAAPQRLLLLSGGSGITPVMSMLRALSAKNEVRDVVFMHAARSNRDVIFAAELDRLARRHGGLRVVIAAEDEGGRIDAGKLRAFVPDWAERDTYLCGPAPMMDALGATWAAAGLEERLRTERFGAPKASPVGTSSGAKVRLTMASGREVEADGTRSLLETLEAAGETPAYGCRMGICHTCRCTKREGVVENMLTGELSTEPNEAIRLCVSRAKTDVKLAP